jgi:hypothetical protein
MDEREFGDAQLASVGVAFRAFGDVSRKQDGRAGRLEDSGRLTAIGRVVEWPRTDVRVESGAVFRRG